MTLRALLYPLGLISSLLFGVRFMIQWIHSEKRGQSFVPPLFWHCSLAGNLCMVLHGLIQIQYPICLIQTLNCVIALRNLDLMQKRRFSKQQVFVAMAIASLFVTLLFLSQGLWSNTPLAWMRAPEIPGLNAPTPLPLFWHLAGSVGLVLFACRFWIQWWLAERNQQSKLGQSFWWMSLTGAFLSLLYVVRLRDIVNVIAYSISLIPYARNLQLARRAS